MEVNKLYDELIALLYADKTPQVWVIIEQKMLRLRELDADIHSLVVKKFEELIDADTDQACEDNTGTSTGYNPTGMFEAGWDLSYMSPNY